MLAGATLQAGLLLRHGTWVSNRVDSPTLETMNQQKQRSLNYFHNSGRGAYTHVVLRQIERSHLEPYLGKALVRDDPEQAVTACVVVE